MEKKNKNMDRNLVYNRNEKRINDTHAKHNLASDKEEFQKLKQGKQEDTISIEGEDSTKYGEFVSTFHQWLPIEEQKDMAKDLEDMTKE